jgi:uncharacterized delta-60 repeat protein
MDKTFTPRWSAIMIQVQKAAGTLDPAFGTNGVVTLPFGDIVGSIPAAVLPQSDNKLLVAVATTPSQMAHSKIARLDEKGRLDPTFGTAGIVEIPFDKGIWFSPRRLHSLMNEGWLITGTAESRTEPELVDLAVVRQLKDGALDTTFGKDGKVTLNIYELIGASRDREIRFLTHRHDQKHHDMQAVSVGDVGATTLVQQDGKIVLVSTVFYGYGDQQGIVIRLNKDGSLDTSFNQKGFLLVELPDIERIWNKAYGVTLQQDGKVLVCGGFSQTPGGLSQEAYVIRYGESGKIDSSYGDNGVVIVAGSIGLHLYSMTLKPDGGIIATGSGNAREKQEVGLIVSLNDSGSFNLVFNNGRPLFSDFLDEGLYWRRSILQEDGKILVFGDGGGVFIGENSSLVTARFLADGSLDETFGDGGWVVFNDEKGFDLYKDSALMSDNRAVICGHMMNIPIRGRVVRYLGDVVS